MADTVQSLEDSLARLEKLQTQVRHPPIPTHERQSQHLTNIHIARRLALHNPKPGLTSHQTPN